MHRVLLSARQRAQAEPAPEDVAFHPARMGKAFRALRRTAAPGVKLPARVFACGFWLNKRRSLRRFAGDSIVHCVRHARRIPPGSTLLLWGSTAAPPGLTADVTLIRVEDGFLRSVGLGAELARPVSWVLDRTGIYYDATRPSDLEQLLQSCEFTPQLLARAAALRERSEEHTSELQSRLHLVCRLLLEKKNGHARGGPAGPPHGHGHRPRPVCSLIP